MTEEQILETLLAFFKALADENRLRIIGLLAEREHSVEDLATRLQLQPSTVSHHLSRLADVGLVSVRAESYYRYYRFNRDALHEMTRKLFADDTLPAISANIGSYEEKVLRDFLLPDGRLKQIPAQLKKQLVILRHVRDLFEPGRRYTEKEVNAIIKPFHEDTAGLRRGMIDHGLMQREGGVYWYEPETA